MKLKSIKSGIAVAMSIMMLIPNVPVLADETSDTESSTETVVQEMTESVEEESTEKETESVEEKSTEKETESVQEKSTETETKSEAEETTSEETEVETETETESETETEYNEEEILPEDEVLFNTGNYEVSVYKLGELEDDEEYESLPHFDEAGRYTIEIPEMNPYFPYEVQFKYDGQVENEWFMTPDDSVKVGDYTFYVDADFDNTAVTQMNLNVNGKKVVVYPEEKEFTNDGGVMPASLLPLEEKHLAVDLSGFSPLELTSVALSNVFTGDNAIADTRKIAVKYSVYNNKDGYTIQSSGDDINLSIGTTYGGNGSMEMIVGSTDQLDASDVRYIVNVNTTKSRGWLTPNVYVQDEQGVREKKKVAPSGPSSYTSYYYDYSAEERCQYIYAQNVTSQEAYVSLSLDTDTFSKLNTDKIKVYEGNYTSVDQAQKGKDITNQIFASDMTQKDAGYKLEKYDDKWITMVLLDGSTTGCLPFRLRLYSYGKSDTGYINMYSLYSDGQNILNTYSQSVKEGVTNYDVELYKEYPADGQYKLRLSYYNTESTQDNESVTAVYEGKYASIDAANKANAADIRSQLLTNNYGEGYTADYSKGVMFTVFVGEDGNEKQEILYVQVTTKTGDKSSINLSNSTLVNFNGLRGDSDSYISVYQMNNTEDSYSEYNYITLLVADNVDLSNVAPTFYLSDERMKLYAEGSSSPEVSGKSFHDFTNGAVQYTASAENGTDSRNYWVQIVKATEAKLYINSFGDKDAQTREENGVIYSKREVILDSYHENVHDIVLVNMGTEPIKNLKAELSSNVVELDKYWTLNGKYDLAGFSGTDKTTTYGELSNMAKVRLLPKDGATGDISGTLTIKSGNTTLMVLELTGSIGDPDFVTKEIPDAVKYVPYGTMIQNNNRYSWNNVQYTLYSGKLPEGVELKSNGELYGVPKETGEFTFSVRMKVASTHTIYRYRQFTMKVKQNTNENVDAATDKGYEVSTRIPDVASGVDKDQLFVSQGEYGTFKYVYLDGEKLVQNKDFTSEAGSTRITILAETMKKLPKGTHTIGIEFRDESDTLKRAAQNFGINVAAGEDMKEDDKGNTGDNSGNNSGNSENNSSSTSNTTSIVVGNTNVSGVNAAQQVVSAEQVDAQGLPYVDVVTSPNNAKLRLELLQKYYGKNIYLMAHLSNGIGYSIFMSDTVPTEDLDLSSTLNKVDNFAEGFVTFHMQPVNAIKLPYQVGLHINVGAEYAGHIAYIFTLDHITNTYVINNIVVVNEIGNVMINVTELTDVMIMVAKQ